MKTFQYEWYTVEVLESTGRCKWEAKAKNKKNAVEQIRKRAKNQNERMNNENLPWWERCGFVEKIFWDTMTLDRVGHCR